MKTHDKELYKKGREALKKASTRLSQKLSKDSKKTQTSFKRDFPKVSGVYEMRLPKSPYRDAINYLVLILNPASDDCLMWILDGQNYTALDSKAYKNTDYPLYRLVELDYERYPLDYLLDIRVDDTVLIRCAQFGGEINFHWGQINEPDNVPLKSVSEGLFLQLLKFELTRRGKLT